LAHEQEQYGYEIEQVIIERGMREWTAVGFSSIDSLLNKLERKDLVSSRLEPAGRGAARKVHQITPEGEATFQGEVQERLTRPRPPLSPYPLGLASAQGLQPAELVVRLESYRRSLAYRTAHVNTAWTRPCAPVQTDAWVRRQSSTGSRWMKA
jgi:DNA-binding PadR family transcriptional regulator